MLNIILIVERMFFNNFKYEIHFNKIFENNSNNINVGINEHVVKIAITIEIIA